MDLTNKDIFKGIVLNSVLKDMSIEGSRRMLCRRSHGFIIKIKGDTEYSFGDKKTMLSEGQVLFVKKSGSYNIREITPGFSYIINFDAVKVPDTPMERLILPENMDVAHLAEKMYRFNGRGNEYGVMSCIYTLLEKTSSVSDLYLSLRDRKILTPVEGYLAEHMTDSELSYEKLSELSGVSEAYLRRIFKKRYGISPAGYVMRERIRMACSMLTGGEEQTVERIARSVGYRDPLYFSRIFKKHMGVCPTEYRQSHTEDTF